MQGGLFSPPASWLQGTWFCHLDEAGVSGHPARFVTVLGAPSGKRVGCVPPVRAAPPDDDDPRSPPPGARDRVEACDEVVKEAQQLTDLGGKRADLEVKFASAVEVRLGQPRQLLRVGRHGPETRILYCRARSTHRRW